MSEVEEVALEKLRSQVVLQACQQHAEAFKDADIVYPKSWAPFAVMENAPDGQRRQIR